MEKSLSRKRSVKLDLETETDSGSVGTELDWNPRKIPTVSASETLESEPENSSERAILEICFKLVGISSESERRKRLRSDETRVTVSAEEEAASATATRVPKSLASFLRFRATEGRW